MGRAPPAARGLSADMRGTRLERLTVFGAAVALASAAGGSPATANESPLSTEQTVTGDSAAPFSTLRSGPGWRRVRRSELGGPVAPGRERRRRSLLYLTALDEIHYTDEESPGRVEFLDADGTPFVAAWAPAEALRAHSIDRVFRTVNDFVESPLAQGDGSRARMALALTTGDNVDNQQANEQRALLRLLEGGTLDPNSGVERSCAAGPIPAGEAARYTGVQDYDDYIEGGSFFYDPDSPVGKWAPWPRYRGLMDRAQKPFQAEGLRIPSYLSLGNHDRLQQGNQWTNAAFEAVSTGCVKAFAPIPLTSELRPSFAETSPDRLLAVPPDPERRSLSYPELQALFDSGRQRDAHGFAYVDRDQRAASRGAASYYAWSPKPGIRMISLNTVSEGGIVGPSSEGNIDDPQFRWLRRELDAAERKDQLAILFGHHPIASLRSSIPDESAPPCLLGAARDPNPGCDLDPRRSTPVHQGADLESLLKSSPSAVAYIAGHTGATRVTPFARPGGGGFWQIESNAVTDWPNQARLVEVMDNRGGTLSIFGTMLNQRTSIATPASGTDASGFGPDTLASINRLLSFNNPQFDPDAVLGRPDGRNVELLLRDPRRSAGRTIRGTPGDDRLVGTPGDDVIICGPGNDRVFAGAGDDYIDCGAGNDVINAGAGDDRVLGRAGRDFIRGYSGRDRLNGGTGRDRLGGGSGADRIVGSSGGDRIAGGSGRDRIRGGSGRDRVSGGTGRDRIAGGRGGDRLSGGGGRDRVSGNEGNDRLSGSAGNDRLFGGPGRDRLFGGPGRDVLFGGPGRDRLFGGPGRDVLFGGPGRDRLFGGRGRDRLRGGPGRDRVTQR